MARPKKFKPSKGKVVRPFVWALPFAVIGVMMLVLTKAAILPYAIEPEDDNLAGLAQIVPDAGASQQKAILFKSASTSIVLPSPGTWTSATGNLSNLPSECGNLTLLSAVPGSDKLIAGVANRGLWASTNGGTSWSRLGMGAGSASITNRPNNISYDPLDPQIFYEAGIYNGGGVYKTIDGGNTFTQLGSVSHIDFVSVDYTDPARQTLVAGGHEQSRTVWKSTNGGATWTNIGVNLPNGTSFSSAPIVINAQTYLVSAVQSWGGGETGIFRTTNGGTTWTKVSGSGVNNVSAPTTTPPLVTSNGVIYWPTGNNLAKSSDNGLTWTQVGNNNLQNGRVTELPDGRIVSASGSGRLTVTADGGSTWTDFGANMPFNINDRGVVFNQPRNAFYIWEWDCGNNVLPNAIQKLQ